MLELCAPARLENPYNPEKRKRGRNPKAKPEEPESTEQTAPKRGPGRPRKHPKPDPNAPKRPSGRPRKHPKPDPNAPKRPRGRPRKYPLLPPPEAGNGQGDDKEK